MPRPRSLTHAGIASAALAVLDRDGLAALSMRAVAAELGMGTMSLYRYVDDREQLEGLVVDLVVGDVDLTLPPRTTWVEQVTLLTERVHDAITAHPSIIPLLLTHRHNSKGSLRWGEALLGVLTKAGFTDEQLVIAFRGLLSYLFGALQVEHLGPLSGAGTAALAELPSSEYPILADTARRAKHIGATEEFRGGLAVVLRGLSAATTKNPDMNCSG